MFMKNNSYGIEEKFKFVFEYVRLFGYIICCICPLVAVAVGARDPRQETREWSLAYTSNVATNSKINAPRGFK